LFDLAHDAGEANNLAPARATLVHALGQRADQVGGPDTNGAVPMDPKAIARLRALGYVGASRASTASERPDPKDRRDLIARLARVTSGELEGAELVAALEAIVRDDPRNGQAHLRLGYARLQAGDCPAAEREFHAAADTGLPAADIYLGLATCLGRRNDLKGAEEALANARRLEPDNPVVTANIGILQASKGDLSAAIASLQAALAADENLHEARFNLALIYARAGRRSEAAATARDLLIRISPNAPQRPEIERLLRAVQ
jgi:Flp pilus assembly protein TadD